MSLHSWGDRLISRVCVAGAAPPEQGELSLGAAAGQGWQPAEAAAADTGCLKYSQDCETEQMQLGMLVRENNFTPNTSKHPSGFQYGLKKVTAHQALDSCIATKGSDCGTDSRSSAR